MFLPHLRSILHLPSTSHARVMLQSNFGALSFATQKVRSYTTDMFCFQCEQTKDNVGCTTMGVCGKNPDVAAMQDLLIHATKGLAQYTSRARAAGLSEEELEPYEKFLLRSVFSTLTNVNFSEEDMKNYLLRSSELKEKLKGKVGAVSGPAEWKPPASGAIADFVSDGKAIGIQERERQLGKEVMSLQELITYGLKGMCAYADHAQLLGEYDAQVGAFVSDCLNFLTTEDAKKPESLLEYIHQTGLTNFHVLELLDKGHRKNFGVPEPTHVRITPVEGKCILVSGHDIKDLESILQQCEGSGVNVYTHGELLPANAYPEIKKYKCLKGNYGGPWQLQKYEFSNFPGAIILTTNCLMPPRETYKSRLFTAGAVGYPGVKHVDNRDWSEAIKVAQSLEGFTPEKLKKFGHDHAITIGFGHETVLGLAEHVIKAVKDGHISRFFVIGGCDGTETERNYFTDLARSVPETGVVLTAGCGKYRFNHHHFGNVPGTDIPRLLDLGQCNDSYAAVKIALALADAFECGVNDLPLSIALSWFEQKAVAVLLSLLNLGVKNIRIGPRVPAFLTPSTVELLNAKYNLMPVSERPQEDMAKMMEGH